MESSVGSADADFDFVHNNVSTFENEDASIGELKSSHDSNLRLHETGYVNVNERNPSGHSAKKSDEKTEEPVATDDSSATSWSEMNMDAITKVGAEYRNMKESLGLTEIRYENTTHITGDRGDKKNDKTDCGEYLRMQENSLYAPDAPTEGGCQKDSISWTAETLTDSDAWNIDEYIDMKIQRLSYGRTQFQDSVKILKQDASTEVGSQKVALSWGTNTTLDIDACSIDEYIDMKIQRLYLGDTQSQEAEKILKSTIKTIIKSSLMKNKQLYELFKVPNCELELESFISDIADACLRASKEKDIRKSSHENDINVVDTGNVENGDATATNSRVESPEHVVESNIARNRILGGAHLQIMQNGGKGTTKTFAENKASKSEDRVYDYAYATRKSANTKFHQSNQSNASSSTKNNISSLPNESPQKDQRSAVNVKKRLHSSTTRQVTDERIDDIDKNNLYSNSERVTSPKKAIGLNPIDEAIKESQSIENETIKQESCIEIKNIESNKLLQWAVESGHRRVNKSVYKAADDKVYINSYDEIDNLPAAVRTQSSGFSCSNSMKLKFSIIFLVAVFLAFTIFLTIVIVRL